MNSLEQTVQKFAMSFEQQANISNVLQYLDGAMDHYDFRDNINISDIIEAIQTTDPEFLVDPRCQQQQQVINMMSGGSVETVKPIPVNRGKTIPFVEIIEQPAGKALRFRYECEGRSAGSIPGVNSTPENKSFPSIRVVGYKGRAVVVVSCVTKDPPYRPHPHNLVGKEASRGVCKVEISSENMTVTFAGLGIQCVKKKDIDEALRIREEIRIDPFKTGFDHRKQPTGIDLNAVRLCFQVFIEGTEKGKFTVPLKAIVSDPIYDKKAMSDLVICKLSHCSASVAGGMEMMLLCEKVAKEDIQIRFFEERNGRVTWEGYGDFQPSQVHKQVAIAFRTPTYSIQQVDQPVQVYIQLRRPSDNATSDALPFQMLPLGADDADYLKRKRKKCSNNPNLLVLQNVQAEAERHGIINQSRQSSGMPFDLPDIKPEPIDTLLYPRGSPYRNESLSPQNLPPLKPIISSSFEPHTMNSFCAPLDPNPPMSLRKITPQPSTTNSIFNLDSSQFNFDMNDLDNLDPLNSADLAVLGSVLSNNFSSGLYITDSNMAQSSSDKTINS